MNYEKESLPGISEVDATILRFSVALEARQREVVRLNGELERLHEQMHNLHQRVNELSEENEQFRKAQKQAQSVIDAAQQNPDNLNEILNSLGIPQQGNQ